MKALVERFQEGIDHDIMEILEDLVDNDLSWLKYNGESKDVDGLYYVAYRIRAFLMKNTFNMRNARNRTEKSHLSEDYKGLHEFLDALYQADWLELDWRLLNNYNFSTIYDNEQEIRDYLGATQYDFFNLLKQFEGLSQESDEFKKDFKEVKDDLFPLFQRAFAYAIDKVDLNRTEKEIVKYVNKAMLTKFIELQMKRDNVKRIRRGNDSIYIKVATTDEHDAWMLIFGKTLKHIGGLEPFKLWLTPRQVEFAQQVYDIVDEDLRENNTESFRWDEKGNPIMIKRYVADKIGMEETNFKQTLKRCEKKIYDNWKDVISERLK